MVDAAGAFRSSAARENFADLLQRAMARWPEHRTGTVDTSFGRTAFSTTLNTNASAPLVLLQGGGSTAAIWTNLATTWAQHRTVTAIDTIWDAGRSLQRAPIPDGAHAAAWLAEVLDGLGYDRCHLLGYSYGGWLALEFASRHSARLHSCTAIEPPAAIAPIPPGAWWRMLRMIVGGERAFRSYLRWVRGGVLPDASAYELLLAAQRDFIRRGSPPPRTLPEHAWERIECPLTLVLAERSRLLPRSAAHRAAVLAPTAEIHSIDASHAVLIDDERAIAAIVEDFLARSVPR